MARANSPLAQPHSLNELSGNGQIVLQYGDDQGQPTQEYPANPNGSAEAIAGLCDPTGRIFGMMPHPERFVDPWHHPRWTRAAPVSRLKGMVYESFEEPWRLCEADEHSTQISVRSFHITIHKHQVETWH